MNWWDLLIRSLAPPSPSPQPQPQPPSTPWIPFVVPAPSWGPVQWGTQWVGVGRSSMGQPIGVAQPLLSPIPPQATTPGQWVSQSQPTASTPQPQAAAPQPATQPQATPFTSWVQARFQPNPNRQLADWWNGLRTNPAPWWRNRWGD